MVVRTRTICPVEGGQAGGWTDGWMTRLAILSSKGISTVFFPNTTLQNKPFRLNRLSGKRGDRASERVVHSMFTRCSEWKRGERSEEYQKNWTNKNNP